MNKTESLKIGLALNSIAMICDDATLDKINPYLKEIESLVMHHIDAQEILMKELRDKVDRGECDSKILQLCEQYLLGSSDI